MVYREREIGVGNDASNLIWSEAQKFVDKKKTKKKNNQRKWPKIQNEVTEKYKNKIIKMSKKKILLTFERNETRKGLEEKLKSYFH